MAKARGLGERACPRCKEVIKVEAHLCKHCGAEFSAEDIAAAKAESRSGTKKAGVGCLALVLLLGLCTYTVGDESGEGSTTVSQGPSGSAKADVIAFYQEVSRAMRPCEEAGQRVAEAAETGDVVEIYRAADRTESACLSIPSDIAAIDVPDSVGREAHEKLTDAKDACENTTLQRWSMARGMKEALNGDGGVGALADLQDSAEMLQAGTILCAAGLVGQAMELGATDADLGISVSET